MGKRFIFYILVCIHCVYIFDIKASAVNINDLQSLLGDSSSSDSSSNSLLTSALFGQTDTSSGSSTSSNASLPNVTASNVTSSAVPSTPSPVNSSQPATSDDITNAINSALNANQATIAQGIEQRVQGSENKTDAEKQQLEQLLIGEFAEDPALVEYLQTYVKMFGDAQYAQVGQSFTANLESIQSASFSQLSTTAFLQQTIEQAEKSLADLYKVYTNYKLRPDITLDNVFTRAFFDVVQLYGMYLQTLAKYLGQVAISGKIVTQDIINLQQCTVLIMASFDSLKGLYFPHQQQLVQDAGSQTFTAETIFAQQVLYVASLSAKKLAADSYVNYYNDCSLALAWSEFITLFTSLPNATYPHTASMNIYVVGYQTFQDYLEEVCGNLAKVLDAGVRTGSNQMTGSAANNKNVLSTLQNYFNAAIQMYALQNTDVAKTASASLQNYFQSMNKTLHDAIATETTITAQVNAARQALQASGKTLAQIQSAVKDFATAQAGYQNLLATFQSIGDATNIAYCNQLLQQLAGDNFIGLACLYWQSFLQDAKGGGALVAMPLTVTNSTVNSVVSSLDSMCKNAIAILVGTKNPYAFSTADTTTSISQMYTDAVNAYNASSTQVSTAGTVSALQSTPTDSIMNMALLNVLPHALEVMQTYFQNFDQALQALQTVSSDNASEFQSSLQNALSAAQTLQNIAQEYPQFAQFLAPLAGDWNKALISTLTSIFQAQTFTSQPLLQYVYGSVLQASSLYMTSSQQSTMATLLTSLGSQVDIANQVTQSLQAAQAATNSATALSLWNTALNLAQTYYTLGKSQLSVQDSVARLINYISTVQAYIQFALLKTSDFQTALTIYRLAAQAYCATQVCIKANAALPATISANLLGQLLIQTAHNATNTGVLDFIMQDVQNYSAQTDPAKQLAAQTQLQNDMQQLDMYIQNQQKDWAIFSLQSGTSFASLLSGAAGDQNSYVYTVTTPEGATTKYSISNYSIVMQPGSLLQAQAAFQAGQTATASGDFATGTQKYSQAAQLFYNASTSMTDPAAITNAQNQYYLSQTRMQASGVAQMIQPCSLQNVGNFKNLPTAYMVSSAQIIFDPNFVGALPVSLTKTQTAPLSAQQITDFLQVLQIYIVYSALQSGGHDPSLYYKPASLTRVSDLSAAQIALITQYEQTAQNYAAQLQTAFTTGLQNAAQQTLKLTVKLQAQASGGVAITCNNLPIPLLIPVTSEGYTVGAYYIGAYQLFQPGTALLNFGSQIYVPGQDVATAGLLLQDIVQLYIGCAYNYGQIATNIYNQFSSQLASLDDIIMLQDQINAMNIAYQTGLAYIQSNSNSKNTAYGYAQSLAALNSSYSSLPINVNQYVVSLYSQWATQLQSCLVGNPASSGYQNVLSMLNALYLQQGDVMPSMLTQTQQNIAQAFVKAGDACMNFSMLDPVNGRVEVCSYDTASGYYSAALDQYQTLQDVENQDLMNKKLNAGSVAQIEQYMNLYFDVKNNGTTYLDINGKPQTVTWEQLGKDYLTYASSGTNLSSSQVMDAGELAEYNRVKNLVLNAAIHCSYIQNSVASSSSPSNSSGSTPALAQVATALSKFNSVFANLPTAGIDLTDQTTRSNLLQYAIEAYNLFVPTTNLLRAFMSQLSSTLSYQYIYDYLGGLPASTASNFATALQNEWSQFFTALQHEAQSLQNPSSSYLG